LNPTIVKTPTEFKLWYDGNSGSGWRIGNANSEDGINSWNRLDFPVISVGSTDNWETETATTSIIYNSDLHLYQMWYTSINSTNWASGYDRFRLRYATSLDGVNWTEFDDWVLKGNLNDWDSGGIARGVSVLYQNGTYHLWYAATNNKDLTINPFWRIGYATSTDGLNWTKQNGNTPVIQPDSDWELNNVSYPHVIFENGVYRMWYATGAGDLPTQFAYAYSIDGINWTKPMDENPVLMLGPMGSFDSSRISRPFVLHTGNSYSMWYSGFNGSRWSIGYASAVNPTPSPTPSPSPSPTPTPSGPKKVFVIPGMGGSWNRDALLGCKSENYSGEWTSWSKSDQVYKPLLDGLTQAGYEPIPYYYDWRKPVTTTAPLFSAFLQGHLSEWETADIVGHSLGGLVSRSYIELSQENSKLDKLLTVGSPHRGAVNAYPAWSAGVIWDKDIWVRLATLIAQIGCSSHKWSARETIQRIVPSVQNVLPVFDYLKDRQTGLMKSVTEMHAQNNWQPTSFSFPFYGVTVGTLSGTGHNTLRSLEVVRPLFRDRLEGNWLDGRPNNMRVYGDGDGLVLVESSQLEGAKAITLPLDHSQLMADQQGVNAILNFLSETPQIQPLQLNASQRSIPIQSNDASALLIVVQGARATLSDTFGLSQEDSDGQITIIDPHDEPYTLVVRPEKPRRFWWPPKYKVIIAQLFEDGTSTWKEYPQNGSIHRKWKIRFDRRQHSNNAL